MTKKTFLCKTLHGLVVDNNTCPMINSLHNSIRRLLSKVTATPSEGIDIYALKPPIVHLSWWFFYFPKIANLRMAMTIKQARKILGKFAENLSDEDLQMEIKTAELLKAIFFNYYSKNKTNEKIS